MSGDSDGSEFDWSAEELAELEAELEELERTDPEVAEAAELLRQAEARWRSTFTKDGGHDPEERD